jgi:hypothetical protein
MEHICERAGAQIKRITQKGRKTKKKEKQKKKEKTKKNRKKQKTHSRFDLIDDGVSPSANCAELHSTLTRSVLSPS